MSPNPDPKYKVADLSLADWGRKEIAIAEHESCAESMAPRSRLPARESRVAFT